MTTSAVWRVRIRAVFYAELSRPRNDVATRAISEGVRLRIDGHAVQGDFTVMANSPQTAVTQATEKWQTVSRRLDLPVGRIDELDLSRIKGATSKARGMAPRPTLRLVTAR